jgi:hypothetical protein
MIGGQLRTFWFAPSLNSNYTFEVAENLGRTTRLPVVVGPDGALAVRGGSPLPKFLPHSKLELLVPLNAFADADERRSYVQEYVATIASANTRAALGISRKSLLPEQMSQILKPHEMYILSQYVFVEVLLKRPLGLRFRTGKSAELAPCECVIPSMKNRPARSLNHAFTLISEHYETHRISHTANVFERAYLFRDNGWVQLDAIRRQLSGDLPESCEKPALIL